MQQRLPLDHSTNRRPLLRGLSPAKPTAVLNTFWFFAVERQNVFFKRVSNRTPPWTNDTVIAKHRFTNSYRASDRVSQYLIRNVIYNGDQSASEVFFRTLLFKLFNRIETWEMLKTSIGEISWVDYEFSKYNAVLTKALEDKKRIYSAAYIMPSGGGHSIHKYKHSMHLKLLETMTADGLAERICDAKTMEEAFYLLRGYPTIGDFLAYQFVTDLNYSNLTNFSESEFTVAGPGARDGISKCFSDLGGLTETEIIKLVADKQEDFLEQLGLTFKYLWGRRLQYIDVQNLFCEVSKYSRVTHPMIKGISGRSRIKQKYKMGEFLDLPWYPPKWDLNEAIDNWASAITG